MKKDPSLWLARHAPVLVEQGVCYGSSDLPADSKATATAAAELAEKLSSGVAVRVSPLGRCQQLARALQVLRPELSFHDDLRLREIDFSAWEGKPWANIPKAEFDLWLSDFCNGRPGTNGETVAELMNRVTEAWREWKAGGVETLWITHAGVMRAALLISKGADLPASAADWPAVELPFGKTLKLSSAA